MNKIKPELSSSFVQDIKTIIGQARTNAVRSVEFHRVEMYWKMGERIFNEEQQGKERADYGAYLIRDLAEQLEPEFGSGFSHRQLERCRQFYRTFPITSALRTQFNWSQYKLLISIDDKDKREYYELEAVKNAWTGRELERQINSICPPKANCCTSLRKSWRIWAPTPIPLQQIQIHKRKNGHNKQHQHVSLILAQPHQWLCS